MANMISGQVVGRSRSDCTRYIPAMIPAVRSEIRSALKALGDPGTMTPREAASAIIKFHAIFDGYTDLTSQEIKLLDDYKAQCADGRLEEQM